VRIEKALDDHFEMRMDPGTVDACAIATEGHSMSFQVRITLIQENEMPFPLRELCQRRPRDQAGEASGMMHKRQEVILHRPHHMDRHGHHRQSAGVVARTQRWIERYHSFDTLVAIRTGGRRSRK